MKFRSIFNPKQTPQSEPIPGREAEMHKNAAGGYAFTLDSWKTMDRFLILGTEGGTYYVGERKLTKEAAMNVAGCIKADGARAVARIVEISDSGRAPKNDPAIFALAMAMKTGDDKTRALARAAIPKVCRIGTHLFQLIDNLELFGGWGRGTRTAIGKWYTQFSPRDLAFQVTKYQARGGQGSRWSHRDALRLAHLKPQDDAYGEILAYVVKETSPVRTEEGAFKYGDSSAYLDAVERAKKETGSELLGLISEFRLPMEVIPTDKRSADVYRLMLQNYGLTALLRNLGNLSRHEVLVDTDREVVSHVCQRLTNEEAIRKSRVHPLAFLIASKVYGMGQGIKGSGIWRPVGDVIDALDEAFYKAFKNVEPTGKVRLLGLDVSSSMSNGAIAGGPISPCEATAALAMITKRVETGALFRAFSDKLIDVDSVFSRRRRLNDVIGDLRKINFGSTDCSLPIRYAIQNRLTGIDSFEIYTDNETWYGREHVSQALTEYRTKYNPNAKFVVVGMTATCSSIADQSDKQSLDVIGFDTATPQLISEFILGNV